MNMKRQFKKSIYLSIDDIVESDTTQKCRIVGIQTNQFLSSPTTRVVNILLSDGSSFSTSERSEIEIFHSSILGDSNE